MKSFFCDNPTIAFGFGLLVEETLNKSASGMQRTAHGAQMTRQRSRGEGSCAKRVMPEPQRSCGEG